MTKTFIWFAVQEQSMRQTGMAMNVTWKISIIFHPHIATMVDAEDHFVHVDTHDRLSIPSADGSLIDCVDHE
jgi:hypothetical protein